MRFPAATQHELLVRNTVDHWLRLRVFTLLWVVVVSVYRPMTQREQAIPAWPPSEPLLGWIERVVLAPWQRWDVKYFMSIVESGYRLDNGTAQWHPLYPWLSKPFALLTGTPLLGLLAVSSLAGLGFFLVYRRLASLDLSPDEAVFSEKLARLFPVSFILFAPYSEALFLLCAAWCLLEARNGRWIQAGVAGALATLTRQQGLFLLLPLAWELWAARARWRQWACAAMIPGAMALWIVFRAFALADVHPDLSSVNAFVYSVVISPSSAAVVQQQAFLPPWKALTLAVAAGWSVPNIVDAILAGLFMILVVLAWPRMRASYRLYVVTITVVSFALYTGPKFPYMGLPRHLLLAFPTFIGAAPAISSGAGRRLVSLMLLGSFMFLLVCYEFEAWIP